MIATPASLLALAASLDAHGDTLKAQAATIRAAIKSSENQPHALDAITLEVHMARTGQNKRQGREWFARAERAGFRVVRLGHALSMDVADWTRAVEALASKRSAAVPPSSAPTDSSDADDSPAAILARAGFMPTRAPQRQRGSRPTRAA